MENFFTSLGLMSGTSMDGIDASIIRSNGENKYETIIDRYFEYDEDIYQELINIRDKITSSKDLTYYSDLISDVERKITLFHAAVSKKVIEESSTDIDFVGFHGQTIFHNSKEKITKQLGDGNLLSSLLKKRVVYNFRQNDIDNDGQGAPLAPIFHHLLIKQKQIKLPVCILNIGGIANITIMKSNKINDLMSYDIGPGNCLLDELVRKKTKNKCDVDGKLAKNGNTNINILNQAIDNFESTKKTKNLSLDINDFNLNFIRGLTIEDGLSTLSDFTATLISEAIQNSINIKKDEILEVLVCGGGRKNTNLIDNIKKKFPKNIILKLIDDYEMNGDFIESQAFAYLAIRSYLKLPISFPQTTNVKTPCVGGILVKNY